MNINYDIEVYCSRCAVRHEKNNCKLIPNWGYQCPFCGNKCRVKPKYTCVNYNKQHPFESTGRRGRSEIRREIRAIAKAKELE